MSRSDKSFTRTHLYVLRMLDKAMWALLRRKVDHATLLEVNGIKDLSPSNSGAMYTEFVFQVTSFVTAPEANHVCYVRIWLRNLNQVQNDLRIEKITITSPKAILLAEWDGMKQGNESFEVFMRNLNCACMQSLIELVPTQHQIFPDRTPSAQLATMVPETVITYCTKDTIVVQVMDSVFPTLLVAQLILHVNDGVFCAKSITLFVRDSKNAAVPHHYNCSGNRGSNQYKLTN